MDDESRASTTTPGATGSMNGSPGDGGAKKPAGSRKSHRKTRTGCKTCKQRKIKCDENRPCNNCIKHSVRCDFLDQSSLSDRTLNQHSSNHGSPSGSNLPAANLPSFERFAADALSGSHSQSLQIQDLELLHYYSTHTAMSLHSDPAIQTLMRVNVPQLGFKYEFVMRGVLAVAALHLARFKPDQHDYYSAQSKHHQEIGLREASALIPNITEENCSAVYIFSVLTFYICLARPRKAGDFFVVGEGGVADWIFLIKGTSYIMQSSYESLSNGPFGPLFKAGSRRHDWRISLADSHESQYEPLFDLPHLIRANIKDPARLQVYEEAMEGLRRSFVVAEASMGVDMGDMFVWVFQLSEDFVQLLRDQTREALCILAYFCILLKQLDRYWWMEGWSIHLITKIYEALDEEHRLWIRAPIEQIGWIPN